MKNVLIRRYTLPTIIFALLLLSSCEKEKQEQFVSESPDVVSITEITEIHSLKQAIESRSNSLSSEEQEKLHRFRQAALILFEVAKNDIARTEVIDGVRTSFYEDESILFKDLFDAASSPAFQFQSRESLKNDFQNRLQNGNYMNSHEYGVTPTKPAGDGFDLISYLGCNRFQIYWPYSDNWRNESSIVPTITYSPVEQEDINIGWKLIPATTGYTFQEVIVNEEYAQNNPVWIVNSYEGDKVDGNCNYVSSGPAGPNPGMPEGGNCAGFPDDEVQVNIGKVKFFQQYDGLFQGGPEFRWVRGNLSLDGNGQVTGVVPAFAKANLRRKDKYDWKNANQPIWDTNWKNLKEDQFVALYEEDDFQDDKVTVSGTVSYKTDPNTTTSTTYSYTGEFKSKDDVVYNVQYDRCWYFETSDDNTPFENYQGWNVRGSQGEVKWTMPYLYW